MFAADRVEGMSSLSQPNSQISPEVGFASAITRNKRGAGAKLQLQHVIHTYRVQNGSNRFAETVSTSRKVSRSSGGGELGLSNQCLCCICTES